MFQADAKVSGLQFFITVGGLLATGVNKAFSTRTDPAGWLIPVGITMIFPATVLCGLPFLPDAPRWLLFHGRREDAIKTLRKVRPKSDVDEGICELEVDAIAHALEATPEKGSWLDCFRGTNLRRTLIVILAMTAQQCTGQVNHPAPLSSPCHHRYLLRQVPAKKLFADPYLGFRLPVRDSILHLGRSWRQGIHLPHHRFCIDIGSSIGRNVSPR